MSTATKKTKTQIGLLGALLCLAALVLPSSATAAAPQWSLSLSTLPSSFASGESGNTTEGPAYKILATNKGDGPTAGPYTITDVFPDDVIPGTAEVLAGSLSCLTNGQEVSCTGSAPIGAGGKVEVIVPVDVASGISGKNIFDEATVEGGGASPAKAKVRTAVGLPAWKLYSLTAPTNLVPGAEKSQIILQVVNVGGATTHGPVTITDTLPQGLTLADATFGATPCPVSGQVVTCSLNEPITPGEFVLVNIRVNVDPLASGTLVDEAEVEGGGANLARSVLPIDVTTELPSFGFLPGEEGFAAPLTAADGSAATQAGSHPNQLTVQFGFPAEKPSRLVIVSTGHVRDISTDLAPGEIVNPNSTAKLCTEVQLVTRNCPSESQIGTDTLSTAGIGLAIAGSTPMYNMVPAPGAPSTFGFDAAGVGIFVHVKGSLRSDGDYGLSGTSNDILARGANPVLGVRLSFWGDPSSSSHEDSRECHGGERCPPPEESKTALLTTPVQCSGQPMITRARADSWEETGTFKGASYESADLAGEPNSITGCNQLQYEPSLEARPTTNLADSPSGLEVDIHQPVNEDPDGLAPAMMRGLRLALPQGMSVNPSSANGLGACSEAQSHFHTLIPGECPNDSKLGSAEVITPLLNHPVPGALYLAEPLKNPTGSLIGLYLELNDPSTNTVSNIAGRAIADPQTGQLTTVFEDNPQLPIEHIRTHLFTGPRAALRTPANCGSYASKADLTPWSSPETPVAHLSDPWQIQANPNGGKCPAQGEQLPNTPSFTAGTLSPQAGDYSPFLFKLTRKDDTAEPLKVDTTLPPGLVAKLAGIPYCSEADIAKAAARSNPNEGVLEQQSPSCPAASKVGTLDVATGAGITPYHAQGNVYLSGPYKGAPLSLAIITPAVAGPFDLGVVVSRVMLNVDPETAKVTATSDPLPSILYGIPLDIRSIALQMDRPDFTINPTSCDPFSITGSLLTATAGSSPLLVPFQVGECGALGFKPKLAIRLKGGTTRGAHPALTANVTYPSKGKYANIKVAQVTLPHSEFLDQAHIGTVCTRVQFAANACPAKSVYGKAMATTPILGAPLEGPVYLRSSSHELPDLVIDLKGQVDVVVVGRIDSINGGIRTTFEAVPDAPVSKFTLQMQGGKKGLLVNSRNLCAHPAANKATSLMEAQNGKVFDTTPVLKTSCKKAKLHEAHHKHKSAR
jgi:hypothetical protein